MGNIATPGRNNIWFRARTWLIFFESGFFYVHCHCLLQKDTKKPDSALQGKWTGYTIQRTYV